MSPAFMEITPHSSLQTYNNTHFHSKPKTLDKMKTPIRIAVLECDTPMDAVKAKYGTYGDVFTRLLQSGADALGMPEVVSSNKGLEISKWDVVNKQEYPELEDIDAILMTGSRKFTNCPYTHY
jgi:hypothetical protein